MRIDRTRCLFGGTLLAAGLTAGALGQFNVSLGDAKTFANDYSVGFDMDYLQSPGPFVLESAMFTDQVSAHGVVSVQSNLMRTEASLNTAQGFGGAYGSLRAAYFTVDQHTPALAEWDWTVWSGSLSVFDITTHSSMLYAYGSVSGSAPLEFEPGHQYYVDGVSAVWGQGDFMTYWQITVPAPGSASVLGMAWLVAARRRRTLPRRR